MGTVLLFLALSALIAFSALASRGYANKQNREAKKRGFLESIAVEYMNVYRESESFSDHEFHQNLLSGLFQAHYCGATNGISWRSVMQMSPCVTRNELYEYVDGELHLWLIRQGTIFAIDEETALQAPTSLAGSLEPEGN